MSIPLLEQRATEAAVLGAVYAAARPALGGAGALELITRAVSALAGQAGREFAAQAPGGPNFAHFKTIVEKWRACGALEIAGVHGSDTELCFTVTRCAYVERYRAMGLPPELAAVLSCCRDEPFAQGYSPRIVMERPSTLGQGGASCPFRFVWSGA